MSSVNATQIENELNQVNQLIQIPPMPNNPTASQLASYYSNLANNYSQAISILQEVLKQMPPTVNTSDIQSELTELQEYLQYFQALYNYYNTIAQAPTEFSGSVQQQIQQVQDALNLYQNALNYINNLNLQDQTLQENINNLISSTQQQIQYLQNLLNALKQLNVAYGYINQANQILGNLPQPNQNMTASQLAQLYNKDATELEDALQLLQEALPILQQVNQVIDVSETISSVQSTIQQIQSNIQLASSLAGFYNELAQAPQPPPQPSQNNGNTQVNVDIDQQLDQEIQYTQDTIVIVQDALTNLTRNNNVASNPQIQQLIQAYQEQIRQLETQLRQLKEEKSIYDEYVKQANQYIVEANNDISEAESLLSSESSSSSGSSTAPVNLAQVSQLFQQASQYFAKAYQLLSQAYNQAQADGLIDTAQSLQNDLQQVQSAQQTAELLAKFYDLENKISEALDELNAQMNSQNPPSPAQISQVYNNILSMLTSFSNSVSSYPDADQQTVQSIEEEVNSQWQLYSLVRQGYGYLADNEPQPPNIPGNPDLSQLPSVYSELANYYAGVAKALQGADQYFIQANGGQDPLANEIQQYQELAQAFNDASEVAQLLNSGDYEGALRLSARYYSVYGDSLTVNGQAIPLPFKSLNVMAQLMNYSQQLNQIIQQAENIVNNPSNEITSNPELQTKYYRYHHNKQEYSATIDAFNQAINLLKSKALPLAQQIDQLQNQLNSNTNASSPTQYGRPSITPGAGLGSQPQTSTTQFVQELIDLFSYEKDATEAIQQLNIDISNANNYANEQDYVDAISSVQDAIQQTYRAITDYNSCYAIAQDLNDQNAVQTFQQNIQSLQNTIQNLKKMIEQLKLAQQFNEGVHKAEEYAKQGDFQDAITTLQGLQGIAQQLTQLMQQSGQQTNQPTPTQILNDLIQMYQDFQQALQLLKDMQNNLQTATNALNSLTTDVLAQYKTAYEHAKRAVDDLEQLLPLQNQINEIRNQLPQNQPNQQNQPVQFLKPDTVANILNFYNQLKAEYNRLKNTNIIAQAFFTFANDVTQAFNDAINAINDAIEHVVPKVGQVLAGIVDGVIFTVLSIVTGGIFDVVYGVAFLGNLVFDIVIEQQSIQSILSGIFNYMKSPQGLAMLGASIGLGAIAGLTHAFDVVTDRLPTTLKDFSDATDPLKIAKKVFTKIADKLKAKMPDPKIIDVSISNGIAKITTDVGDVTKSLKDVGKDIKTLDDLDKFIKNFQDLKSAMDFINKLKLKAKEFDDVAIKAQVEKINIISLKIEQTAKDVTITIEKDLRVGKIEGVEKLPPEQGKLVTDEVGNLEWKTKGGGKPNELAQQTINEAQQIFGKPEEGVRFGKYKVDLSEQKIKVGKLAGTTKTGKFKLQTGTLEKETTGVAGNYVTQREIITSEKGANGLPLGRTLEYGEAVKLEMSREPLGARLYEYFQRLVSSGKLKLSDADMKLLKAFLDTKTERVAENLTDVADKVLNEFYNLKDNLIKGFKDLLDEKGLKVNDVKELFNKLVMDTDFGGDFNDPATFAQDLMETLAKDPSKYGLLDEINRMADYLYKKYNITERQAYQAVYKFLTSDMYDSLDSLAQDEGWSPRTNTQNQTAQGQGNASNASQNGSSPSQSGASPQSQTSPSSTGNASNNTTSPGNTPGTGQGQNVTTGSPPQPQAPSVSLPGESSTPTPTRTLKGNNTAGNNVGGNVSGKSASGSGSGGTTTLANGLNALIKEAPEQVKETLTRIPLSKLTDSIFGKLGDLASDFKSLPRDLQEGLVVSALDDLADRVTGMSLDQLVSEVAKFIEDVLPDVKDALDRLDLVKEVKDFKLDKYAEEQIMKNPTEATEIAESTIRYAKTLDNLLKVLDILGYTVLKPLKLTLLASSLEVGDTTKLTQSALSQLYQLANTFVTAGYTIERVLSTPQVKASIMSVLRGIETGIITSLDQVAQVLGVSVQALQGFTSPKEVYYALQELLDKLTNLDKYVFVEVNTYGTRTLGVIVPLSTGLELITLNPPTITSGTGYGVSTTSTSTVASTGIGTGTGTSTGTDITPTYIQSEMVTEQEVQEQLSVPVISTPPEPKNGKQNNNNGITPSPNIGYVNRPYGNTRGYGQVLTI